MPPASPVGLRTVQALEGTSKSASSLGPTTLVDARGAALTDLPFIARDLSGPGLLQGRSVKGRTDSEGRIDLDLDPSGTWFLTVDAGYPFLLPIPAELTGLGRLDLGTLVVPEVKTVAGRLLDARGRPVQGARILAWSRGRLSEAYLEGPDNSDCVLLCCLGYPILTSLEGRWLLLDASQCARAMADALPLAQATTLPSGEFHLSTTGAEDIDCMLVRLDAGAAFLFFPDSDADLAELALPEARTLLGSVRIEGRGPGAGWQVCAWPLTPFTGSKALEPVLQQTTCDEQGRFRFDHLPPVRERILLGIRPSAQDPWALHEVEARAEVNLLAAPPCQLTLRLLTEEGDVSAAQATLKVINSTTRWPGALPFLEGRKTRVFDDEGSRLILDQIWPGRYLLEVQAEGYASVVRELDLAGTQERIDLTLERVGPRSIVVETDGQRLDGRLVRLILAPPLSGPCATGVTDDRGQVLLEGVPRHLPKGAILEVEDAPGLAQWSDAASVLDQDLAKIELRKTQPQVLCHDRGQPPAAALIVAMRKADLVHPLPLPPVRLAWSDDLGLASYADLPAGTWRAVTSACAPWGNLRSLMGLLTMSARGRESKDTLLEPGSCRTLRIPLDRFDFGLDPPQGTGVIVVEVTLGGAPQLRAVGRLRFVDRSGTREVSSRANDRGVIAFEGLGPGTWALLIDPDPDGTLEPLAQSVHLEDAAKVEILCHLLQEPLVVDARLEGGSPAALAVLSLRDRSGRVWKQSVMRSGILTTWRHTGALHACLTHATGSAMAEVRGDGPLVLEVEPGLLVSGLAFLPSSSTDPQPPAGFELVACKEGAPECSLTARLGQADSAMGAPFEWKGMQKGTWIIEAHPYGVERMESPFQPLRLLVEGDAPSAGLLQFQVR